MPLPDKFTVAGSPEQVALLLPILEAMYLGFKEVESNNQSVYGLPPGPEFDEWLQLTLHWKGLIVGTKKWHREEKSVRLKGINPRTQGLEYFQALGRKIISKFDNLNFRSGRVKCKYTNWKDGFQTWGYFSSKEVGYHIIETMGDIVNKPIDKKIFKHEGVLDEAGAFDTTPEKVQIAGKLVRPRQRAPIADLKCYKATILFPWVGHVEELCGVNGYLMPNLNFLDAYDN
jgi:hypothetical protein